MNKYRLIFYVVFGAFHLFLLFFTFYVEANKNDFGILTKILKMISWMKYGAMLGLAFVIADVVWVMITNSENNREKDSLKDEINVLKAKLFDMQEASKEQVQKPVDPNQ